MDEKLKNKWIKALRSGKYKQVQENLKGEVYTEDGESLGVGFCCLGVLCEVAPGIKWNEKRGHYEVTQKKLKKLFVGKNNNNDEFDWEQEYDEETHEYKDKDNLDAPLLITSEALPEPLVKEFGLNKMVSYGGNKMPLQSKLVNMNDINLTDFEKIANYVEKVL